MCALKDCSNTMKSQTTEWQKNIRKLYFTKDIKRIYKELLQLTYKR